jgi:hypothetical protein
VPAGGGATPGWYSLSGLTTALTALFVVVAIASAVSIFAFVNRIGLENDILDGESGLDLLDRIDDADGFVGAMVVIYLLLMVSIVVLLCIWTWRAMKNNETLGRTGARFSPGWGIAGWLIPIAWFVIPVLIFQDLWRGSDPSVRPGDPAWRNAKGSGLVAAWATTYIIGSARFGTFGGEANVNDDDEIRSLRTSDTVAAIGMAVSVAAAILAILTFRRIAERQEALRQGVAAA